MIRITAYNHNTQKYQSAEIIGTNNGYLTVDFGDGTYQRVIDNPMTEKQYRYLIDLGVDVFGHETIMSKKQASFVIDAAKGDELESTGLQRLDTIVSYAEPY